MIKSWRFAWKSILKTFEKFTVIRDEEAAVGIDSDESELQPSFDQPSEVLQTAAEDPAQTHSAFSAAIFQEAAFSFLESPPPRRSTGRERFLVYIFFPFGGFHEIAYPCLEKI